MTVHPNNLPEMNGPADLERWVYGTYDRMRVLPNDGLCGVTLALIVVGALIAKVFFVGAAVGAGMLLYRGGRYLLVLRDEEARHNRRRHLEAAFRAKERIWSNAILPTEQKELLSAAVDREVGE